LQNIYAYICCKPKRTTSLTSPLVNGAKIERMKKTYLMLLAAGMLSFTACNNSGEPESTEPETTEEAVTEEPAEAADEGAEATDLIAHVCNDHCTEEACHLHCGEEGHVCSDACNSEEGHDHGDETEAEEGGEAEG
jgi:hypothetical protein